MNWGHIGLYFCGVFSAAPLVILMLALLKSSKTGDEMAMREMDARMHSAIPRSPD